MYFIRNNNVVNSRLVKLIVHCNAVKYSPQLESVLQYTMCITHCTRVQQKQVQRKQIQMKCSIFRFWLLKAITIGNKYKLSINFYSNKWIFVGQMHCIIIDAHEINRLDCSQIGWMHVCGSFTASIKSIPIVGGK